jgi:hypothetical protein
VCTAGLVDLERRKEEMFAYQRAIPLALGLIVAATAPAMATGYLEVFPFSTMQAVDPTIALHQICNSQGSTAYSIVRAGAASPYHSYIIETTGLGTSPVSSALSDTVTWGVAGMDYILPGNTLAFVGTDLLFSDGRTDQVYKVDMSTGTATVYLSKTDLSTQIGGSAVTISNGVTPGGEYVFYESDTDQIVVTAGAGTVSVLVSTTELQNAQGNTVVSGGLTYDADDSLYWGNTTTDDLWKRDTGGTITEVLSTADITAVTGAATVGFGDIFTGPDDLIYFRDTTAKAVLSFDPADADPPSTLEIVLSQSDLENGPAGAAYVDPFSWYAGTDNLAFATIGSGNKGYYSIPEPATLALLGLGGLVLIRRR